VWFWAVAITITAIVFYVLWRNAATRLKLVVASINTPDDVLGTLVKYSGKIEVEPLEKVGSESGCMVLVQIGETARHARNTTVSSLWRHVFAIEESRLEAMTACPTEAV